MNSNIKKYKADLIKFFEGKQQTVPRYYDYHISRKASEYIDIEVAEALIEGGKDSG